MTKSICERHRLEVCAECEGSGTWTFEGFGDCAETLWGIVANVDHGNWDNQSEEWREAARKGRDYYLRLTAAHAPPEQPKE